MSDIFISYRRGGRDSWVARALREHLESEFGDVYLDTSRDANPLGGAFARGIDDALRSCRLVFAVIGQDWMDAIARLSQPDDWTRYELVAAIARGEAVTVVPLWVKPLEIPDWTRLPAELQALGGQNGRSLDADSFDSEAAELVALARKALQVSRTDVTRTAAMPPVLPYLCDRRPQEEALVEVIQAQRTQAPIACVLHGYKREAHEGFSERLSHNRALEDILGARELGVKRVVLQVNRMRWRDRQYRESLIGALKIDLLDRRTASDANVVAALATQAQPLLIVVQVTWTDVLTCGIDLVGQLVAAWTDLLRRGGQDPPALPHPAILWINLTYDDVDTELGRDALGTPLPKLPAIEETDIRTWLALADVKAHLGARAPKIEDWMQRGEGVFSPGKWHMQDFADGVRGMLSLD
jgi:hypothetical protein